MPTSRRTSLCLLALLLPACGGSQEAPSPPKAPARRGPSAGALSPDGRENPTIVGVDLTKLPGEAGEFFRKREEQSEDRRRTQGWLQPADLDLGEHRSGTVAKGRLAFRNPTGKPQTLRNISSSCTCQRLVLHLDRPRLGPKSIVVKKGQFEPIELAAGASGELEVHIEAGERAGKRVAQVVLETSDPHNPWVQVNVSLTAVRDYVLSYTLSPGGRETDSAYLGPVTSLERREFHVRVRARDGKPFRIVEHEKVDAPLRFSFERVDDATWDVAGVAGPGLEEGGFARTVAFETDRGEGFAVTVTALVGSPIRAEPPILAFGLVARGAGARRELSLAPIDRAVRFHVDKVELVDSSVDARYLDVRFDQDEDGKRARITLSLAPGLRGRKVSGKLRVHFKEAAFGPKELPFTGILR